MLIAGMKAPNFSLIGDDSQTHNLKDYLKNRLVIFFYPKDLTAGCTTEACDFSDKVVDFNNLSTKIIGVSKDSLASHTHFKSKHSLRILLLSDPDLVVHKHYGAYGEKTFYNKTTMGVIRSTFLIDEEATIMRAWYRVRVKNHAQSVLDTLKKFKNTL